MWRDAKERCENELRGTESAFQEGTWSLVCLNHQKEVWEVSWMLGIKTFTARKYWVVKGSIIQEREAQQVPVVVGWAQAKWNVK